MSKSHKNREGIVYSTDQNFEYHTPADSETDTLSPEKQSLRVSLDTKARAGKKVTLVSGFVGKEEDLVELSKTLKNKCGVGGSAKEGLILLQGDFRDKVTVILLELRFKVKKI